MMLDELSLLLAKVGPHAKRDAYLSAIVEDNVLGKPTQTTRQQTAKRLYRTLLPRSDLRRLPIAAPLLGG